MTYEIYQTNRENPESVELSFLSYDANLKRGRRIDRSLYDLVYSGTLEPQRPADAALESLFVRFNTAPPSDFTGRSMSVSDVVVLNGRAYYCDSIGFRLLKTF